MKKLFVEITPCDGYIPEHFVELCFSDQQIDMIKAAAKTTEELDVKFAEENKNREYINLCVEFNMPVAKWEGEKYHYKVGYTSVHVYSRTFMITTTTEGSHVLFESDYIDINKLND